MERTFHAYRERIRAPCMFSCCRPYGIIRYTALPVFRRERFPSEQFRQQNDVGRMVDEPAIENAAADQPFLTRRLQLLWGNLQHPAYFVGHEHEIDVTHRAQVYEKVVHVDKLPVPFDELRQNGSGNREGFNGFHVLSFLMNDRSVSGINRLDAPDSLFCRYTV